MRREGRTSESYLKLLWLCNIYCFLNQKKSQFILGCTTTAAETLPNWFCSERIWKLHAKSLQLCPSLWDPVDCSPPGSSVHGILQARILEWVAMPSSRGSSRPRIEALSFTSPALAGRFFITSATWEAHIWKLSTSNLVSCKETDRNPQFNLPLWHLYSD